MARTIDISDGTYAALERLMKADDTANSVIGRLLHCDYQDVFPQAKGSRYDRSVIERKPAAIQDSVKDLTPGVKASQFASEPDYVDKYRSQLINPDSLPSRMLHYIELVGRIDRDELKEQMVQAYGYRGRKSGSMNASIKVLAADGYIRPDVDDLIFVRPYDR